MTYGEAAAVMFEGSGGSNLKTEEFSITENRRYTPSDGYDAISKATVSVPIEEYTYGSIMDAYLSTDSIFSWQLKDFGDNNYHIEIHPAKIPQIAYSVKSTTLSLSEYYTYDYLFAILFHSGIPLWGYKLSGAGTVSYFYPVYNQINDYHLESIQWSGTEYDNAGWYIRHITSPSRYGLYTPSLTLKYTLTQYKKNSTVTYSESSTINYITLIAFYSGVPSYPMDIHISDYGYTQYPNMFTDLGYTELLNEITDLRNYFREQLYN